MGFEQNKRETTTSQRIPEVLSRTRERQQPPRERKKLDREHTHTHIRTHKRKK
jgi:hypothetical protein